MSSVGVPPLLIEHEKIKNNMLIHPQANYSRRVNRPWSILGITASTRSKLACLQKSQKSSLRERIRRQLSKLKQINQLIRRYWLLAIVLRRMPARTRKGTLNKFSPLKRLQWFPHKLRFCGLIHPNRRRNNRRRKGKIDRMTTEATDSTIPTKLGMVVRVPLVSRMMAGQISPKRPRSSRTGSNNNKSFFPLDLCNRIVRSWSSLWIERMMSHKKEIYSTLPLWKLIRSTRADSLALKKGTLKT